MRYDPNQLAALLAVLDEGTFEGAAHALSLTQSAVSQRVKALETRAGRVLVVRSTPCRATPAGERVARLARQWALLSAETTSEIGAADAQPTVLPVAINADSLSTWFLPVMEQVVDWPGMLIELHVEDQEHSLQLLRSGVVMGAVTSNPAAVQGCSSEALGVMRYVPVATPALLEKYRSARRVRWSEMPVVRFNERDDLQERILQEHGVDGHRSAPTHRVPSAEGFAHAVRLGLGWGALPEQHIGTLLTDGELRRLPGARPIDVGLHWQRWRLSSTTLDYFTHALRSAARTLRRAT